MANTTVRFAKIDTESQDPTALIMTPKETRDREVPVMFVWSLMKRLAKVVSLERRARLVAAVVPARHWFRTAVLMSRWHARITSAIRPSRRGVGEAYLREHWLIELSRLGPFPIPMRVSGAELLEPTPADGRGVILCGTHVPLLRVMVRAAVLSGHKPELIVAKSNNITLRDHGLQPTGLNEGVPAVPPGPNALLRIRTVLRRNGLVACTLDGHSGGVTHPDLLVLAARLGARIVTHRTVLAPDGIVWVSFRNAVHPYCETYADIEANMKAIQEEERRLLDQLDGLAAPDLFTAESAAMPLAFDLSVKDRPSQLPPLPPNAERPQAGFRADFASDTEDLDKFSNFPSGQKPLHLRLTASFRQRPFKTRT